jgi:hypothetical protein
MIPSSRNHIRTSTCRANKLGAQYSSTVVISDNHHSPIHPMTDAPTSRWSRYYHRTDADALPRSINKLAANSIKYRHRRVESDPPLR